MELDICFMVVDTTINEEMLASCYQVMYKAIVLKWRQDIPYCSTGLFNIKKEIEGREL